jgi:hypothetical protein
MFADIITFVFIRTELVQKEVVVLHAFTTIHIKGILSLCFGNQYGAVILGSGW